MAMDVTSPAINCGGDKHTLKVRKPFTIMKQRERWAEEEQSKFLESFSVVQTSVATHTRWTFMLVIVCFMTSEGIVIMMDVVFWGLLVQLLVVDYFNLSMGGSLATSPSTRKALHIVVLSATSQDTFDCLTKTMVY